MKIGLAISLFFLAAIFVQYWMAVDGAISPWIFAFLAAGLLGNIGTLLWKRRAGKI